MRGDLEADTEIAQASFQLDLALVGGDPDDVASHFTEDAVLGESGAEDAVGREAIRAFLLRGNEVRTVTRHVLTRDDLLVTGDRAIEFARFDEGKRLRDGREVSERGRVVTDWRRGSDGRWRIARLVVSDLP
ncbi:MAG TPA: nuclear transport factor 2 family protein [Gemmatimonadales bacterium]|nr:nuclear transport factor 2 family protein [Gemmatimonadales bacterium]